MEPTTTSRDQASTEPAPPKGPERPWERVRPTPPKDRQSRETFRPKAPSPIEEVLALHDDELADDEPKPSPDESTVICF